MNESKQVVGLGELLWDLLPTGAQLGGTISNFAVMAARLGDHGICASRLGNDDLGREARRVLSGSPVDTSFLQADPQYATGTVSVELDQGQPAYTIHEPVAWDRLEMTEQWRRLAQQADAVCFGTLAQRSPVSRDTIGRFLAGTSPSCVRIFDLNLRVPFYSEEWIAGSLERATILKMNDAELPVVLELLRLKAVSGSGAQELLRGAKSLFGASSSELICITMGGQGSLLVTRNGYNHHPGFPTKVIDTVGAGDAFTAGLVHAYLRGASLPALNEAGNRLGSWVASQAGAMPPLPASLATS